MDVIPMQSKATALSLIATLCLILCAHATAGQAIADLDRAERVAALRAEGLAAGYNLDYAQALAAFRAAIDVSPEDPALHRLAAATIWMDALFRQGAITVDDYLGQAREKVQRRAPPPELDAAFRAHIKQAASLAEKRLRANPSDPDAHFQVGAAHGYIASYTATIEGGVFAGVRAARRSYSEHSRVLELDRRRKDAGFTVGLYRYAVSMLPAPWRLFAGLAGIGGGRERGLQLVEEAAAHPSDVQANARFTLIAIYNREERYDDALRVIGDLQGMFPRNRLLWLEAGSTALRAGRAGQARKAFEHGLSMLVTDSRPRALGEDARWRYSYGAALVALNEATAAERELRAVLTGEAQEWVRGRAHKELGKLADRTGNRARAAEEYRLAIRIGRAENDGSSADEAARLLKRGPGTLRGSRDE
jgi:tetratricopeptide (TPR) repeat protein